MSIDDIGLFIKHRRKELKISQGDLSELAEVSKNTIYKIERGQANPSVEVLNKLLDTLGLELEIQIKKIKR